MLQTNDTILVSVGNDPASIALHPQTVNIAPQDSYDITIRSVDAAHLAADSDAQQHVFVNNYESGVVAVNFQSDKKEIDSVISKSVEYSAVTRNDGSEFQQYQNGEFIELSDALKQRLQNGANYPLLFDLVLDASADQPIPFQLLVEIPFIINNIFPNSFSIQGSTTLTRIREDENSMSQYQQSLTPLTVLDTVV